MSWTTERARVASLTRSRTPDDPELIDARRNLRAERAADYIRKTLDAAPALSAEQCDRLALLLRGGDAEPPGGVVAPSIRREHESRGSGPAAPAGDGEPPGGPVALSIRRNTSAEVSALGGASA